MDEHREHFPSCHRAGWFTDLVLEIGVNRHLYLLGALAGELETAVDPFLCSKNVVRNDFTIALSLHKTTDPVSSCWYYWIW
jgi:hypothetical protein